MIELMKKFIDKFLYKKDLNYLNGSNEIDFQSETLKIRSDIDSIKSSYPTLLIRSLESDFNDFKNFVDNGHVPSREREDVFSNAKVDTRKEFWHISSLDYNKFTLSKRDNECEIGYKNIKIDVGFYDFGDKFQISDVYLYPTSEFMKNDKLNKIISNYYFYYKMRDLEKLMKIELEKRDYLVSTIGKDIKRDLIIDKILNS